MARKPSAHRWTRKRIPFGYVEDRNGIACLRYQGRRKSTRRGSAPPLRFIPENREICLDMLEDWILRIEHPELFASETSDEQQSEGATAPPQRTLHMLLEEFTDVKYPELTPIVQKRFDLAIAKYFPHDLVLEYEIIYQHLRTQRRKVKAAQETRRKDLQHVNRLLQFAVDREYLTKNPMKVIGIPKHKHNDEDAPIYTPKEIRSIINYFLRRASEPKQKREEQCNFHQYALLFEFLSLTALRSNEALQLRWTDFSDSGFWIMGKGRRKRFFPLLDPATGQRLLPTIDRILAELRQYEVLNKGRLFLWRNTQTPGKALREAKKAMGWKEDGRAVRTFRATAERFWEDELRLDFLLGCQLAGHSAAVRVKNYLKRRAPEELGHAMARDLGVRANGRSSDSSITRQQRHVDLTNTGQKVAKIPGDSRRF